MSRWFRHYTGMMRDEKLVAVAIRSKQPVHLVVWIWGAILESASEIGDGGRFEVDPVEVAYFLRADEADVVAVFDALATAGRLADGVVVKWSDRQYQSDKSAERQARYRERKQGKDRHGDNGAVANDVTQPSRDCVVTPQETDTDQNQKESPPTAPAGGSAALFPELAKAYPQSAHTSLPKSERLFNKLAPDDQRGAISQAAIVARTSEADRTKRGRDAKAHAEFVKGLDTWLREGLWRVTAQPPPPSIATTRLDRQLDAALWQACEQVAGKPAPTSDNSWAFPADIVAQARARCAA